jgi:hypothetical protein
MDLDLLPWQKYAQLRGERRELSVGSRYGGETIRSGYKNRGICYGSDLDLVGLPRGGQPTAMQIFMRMVRSLRSAAR